MCEPTTIMMAAGLAMSAYGSYSSSKAAKNEAEYKSAEARNNQIVANRNATAIEKQGKNEANRYRANVRSAEANQAVSLVAQGGDISDGSNVDLLADTAGLGEFDAQVIESNANTQAHNSRVQATQYGNQSGLYQTQADSQNPTFAAGTTLLSGAGQVSDRWNSVKKAGA